ncbi:hypothetical protein [Haloparvum sedimenti]|uniref:hypothetical protein n=1 Tax=Haloparvum sedimenti TaxID=1678448 RepID=UPI00071E79A1|nr:hypothetical protein [Haloparvum sedimenti]
MAAESRDDGWRRDPPSIVARVVGDLQGGSNDAVAPDLVAEVVDRHFDIDEEELRALVDGLQDRGVLEDHYSDWRNPAQPTCGVTSLWSAKDAVADVIDDQDDGAGVRGTAVVERASEAEDVSPYAAEVALFKLYSEGEVYAASPADGSTAEIGDSRWKLVDF